MPHVLVDKLKETLSSRDKCAGSTNANYHFILYKVQPG